LLLAEAESLNGKCDSTKDDGTPEGCRLATFPSTQSNPCPLDLSARIAQRLPVKVLLAFSRKRAMQRNKNEFHRMPLK